jgi:hypothetical protein
MIGLLLSSPEGLEDAVAKYRLVIEIYRANEKVFLAALHGILEYYDEPGRVEDGARFLFALSQNLQNPENMKTLQGAFSGFALKHRDVMNRIAGEMGLTARQQRESKEEAARIVPSRELVENRSASWEFAFVNIGRYG